MNHRQIILKVFFSFFSAIKRRLDTFFLAPKPHLTNNLTVVFWRFFVADNVLTVDVVVDVTPDGEAELAVADEATLVDAENVESRGTVDADAVVRVTGKIIWKLKSLEIRLDFAIS